MDLGNVLKKVGDATGRIADLGLASNEKISGLLDEYRRAIGSLQAFGLRVGKLRVAVGILPEISTTILGSIDQINSDRIRELLAANPDKKLLSAILSALLTATSIRESVDLTSLREVRIDVTLGIPPKVAVDLL